MDDLVLEPLGDDLAAARAELRPLLTAAEEADGRPALSEPRRRELDGRSARPLGVLARRADRLVGYAQVGRARAAAIRSFALELVVDPAERADGAVEALAHAARDAVQAAGGGTLRCWQYADDGVARGAARTLGLVHERDLHQLRVPLPRPEAAAWPPGVDSRPFRPGADDAVWLAVNNAAFAGHPEQGDWTEADLAVHVAEPWFDPAGFLLAWRGPDLLGFCWTKVHQPAFSDPALGEIYAIGVAPNAHGLRIGGALVLAGLASLHARGVDTGMLYVDAANVAALRLYVRLGFRPHHTDRCWVGRIAP